MVDFQKEILKEKKSKHKKREKREKNSNMKKYNSKT